MENKDLKLVFQKDAPVTGFFRICFIDNFGKISGEIIYGHYIHNDGNKVYLGRCFSYKSMHVGIWNDFSGGINFYSLYTPGLNIDENKYKKELTNIRLDINNAPPAFFCLDIKVPDNWGEIFANELEEFKNKK